MRECETPESNSLSFGNHKTVAPSPFLVLPDRPENDSDLTASVPFFSLEKDTLTVMSAEVSGERGRVKGDVAN